MTAEALISPERWALMSPAEQYALLPNGMEVLQEVFTDEQIAGLMNDWEGWWARPSQREPEGDWREWLLLTGRGFGKTRTCAEWCYKRTLQGSRSGFLLGRTTEQVRDLQVNGPDGLLAIAEAHGTPWDYRSSEAVVVTHTGSRWKMHTSEKPDSVRGPTYDCLTAGHRVDMADGTTRAIEHVRSGDRVATRWGPHRVTDSFRKDKPCIRLELTDGRVIEGGEEHAVWAIGCGWVTLRAILESPCLYEFAPAAPSSSPRPARSSALTTAAAALTTPSNASSDSSPVAVAASSSTRTTASRRTATTARKGPSSGSGKRLTDRFRRVTRSTTGTATTGTTGWRTSNSSPRPNTLLITAAALLGSLGGATRSRRSSASARSAASRTNDSQPRTSGRFVTPARTGASAVFSVERTGTKPTYDFTVGGVHEYQAAGFVHHNSGWIEEFATLRSMVGQDGLTAFDNARFTLRAVMGLQPRLVMATTPKRTKAVKTMLLESKDPAKQIRLTRGSLTENLSNLATSFVEGILNRHAGTALAAQEIDGELASDVEGAIFKSAIFNATRITDERDLPALLKPILTIDPSVGDGSGDECGMTVQALSAGTIPTEMKHGNLSVIRNVRHGYVLEDCSMSGDPDAWANHAVAVCERYGILEVVVEGNQGGELIRPLFRARNPALRVRIVHARVGKEARAQPVAGLFAQGRWHMVGEHPDLEDQCLVRGTMVWTDRGDIPIQEVVPGDKVMTRDGWAPVVLSGQTGKTSRLAVTHVVGSSVWSTENHPIWIESQGRFVPAKDVRPWHRLLLADKHGTSEPTLSSGTAPGSNQTTPAAATIGTPEEDSCTGSSTHLITAEARSSRAATSTTSTRTSPTTRSGTSNSSPRVSTASSMREIDGDGEGCPPKTGLRSALRSGLNVRLSPARAWFAARRTRAALRRRSTVTSTRRVDVGEPVSVYNLKVADGFLPEFYANGILVHNCTTWVPTGTGSTSKSPDRMDALVWGPAHLEPSINKKDPAQYTNPAAFSKSL